ncbi:MAG: hypothetical protein R8F63_18615 [Acidimicrobiales bacterium]|nr:hypothetical protein [Acidimicrobiales bacterium]
MAALDRRTFLVGAAGAAGLVGAGSLLAACGDDGGPPEITTGFLVPTSPDGFVGPSVIVAGVEQRIAYVLHDGEQVLRGDAPATAEIGIFQDGEQVAGGVIERRNTGPASLPQFEMASYYPVLFTPSVPGVYQARWLDGGDETGRQFAVLTAGETAVPQPGDRLPEIHTATTDDLRGIADLCTRGDDCPFHGTDLAAAVAAGDKPIVLSISTPGFCQTEICGPVIELLIEVAAERDDLHVIHAEVYVDAQAAVNDGTFPGPTVDIVNEWQLPFEPVLIAARADGTIVRRLDATYDRSELDETLALL